MKDYEIERLQIWHDSLLRKIGQYQHFVQFVDSVKWQLGPKAEGCLSGMLEELRRVLHESDKDMFKKLKELAENSKVGLEEK